MKTEKKKPALPSLLSPFETPEEEMEDRQETVEKAVMVYYRMLSDLLPKLSRIEDPKKSGMIKHKRMTKQDIGLMLLFITLQEINSIHKCLKSISLHKE